MPDRSGEEEAKEMQATLAHRLKAYGDHSVPPTLLATLITAQYLRPFKALPMLFPPLFLFSSYMNVRGYKKDAAGTSAAWSGLYILLALRRKQAMASKFTVRGAIRGLTLGLCGMQLVAGGLAYTFGGRKEEDHSN